jgi:MFS family permease
LSAGGIVLTPLSARLLNTWGLEATMPWFGALFFLLVLPVALWVVRGHPPPPPATGAPVGPVPVQWGYRDAVRSRFFVLITLGYLVCMGSQVGAIAHLYNRTEQLGDFRGAALAVQALTLASILGRFVGGWLVTRLPIRTFTLGNLVGQAVGLTVIATATGPAQVIAGAALFGSTVGNLLMLHPLWLAEVFGGAAYARIFSLSNALTVAGLAAGPTLLGLVFDAFDYRLAYLAAVAGSLTALALMASAGAQPIATASPGLPAGETDR